MPSYLLLEGGGRLLLETGGGILLEPAEEDADIRILLLAANFYLPESSYDVESNQPDSMLVAQDD